ncbi:MAG TPA: hypothetical protein VES89_07375 [Candidatus Competibacteraceae bacterium]|nr:hypothetical protein [Candidatus Competibacteraceae bacterium]
MKSTAQKKTESRAKVKPERLPTAAVANLSAKPVTESDLSTARPAPQPIPVTAEQPSDLAKFSLEERYQKHARAITIVMASFHLRHLSRLHREFDGDLIMPIILGEIGHYNATRFFSSDGYARNPEDIPIDLESHPLLKPCNAFSISEATGIPRETVRRKVEKLIAMSWLRRDSRGHLFITDKPRKHFVPDFNFESLKELLYASECVRHILNIDLEGKKSE